MGGQTNEHDFHKSVWTEKKLRNVMTEAGLDNIERWQSELDDCASYPVSLNLAGIKQITQNGKPVESVEVDIACVMSVPRYGQMSSRGIIEAALRHFKLPLHTSTGVFWGQCMQRMFEEQVANEVDWILTIDFDSVFNWQQLELMFQTFAARDDIDCLASLQSKRGNHEPLCTNGQETEIKLDDREPFQMTTAHFGLTLIRAKKLEKMRKPWFWSKPTMEGRWTYDAKIDDDIWFWQQWEDAGNTLFIHPQVSIGHVDEIVFWRDVATMELKHSSVEEWRNEFCRGQVSEPVAGVPAGPGGKAG